MKAKRVLKRILTWFDDLPEMRIDTRCRLVEKDHAESPRVFAHVFHRRDRAICVCREFEGLPLGHQVGILLHEIGHLMSNGGEAEADLWVDDNLGIDIDYRSTLQWVDPGMVGL